MEHAYIEKILKEEGYPSFMVEQTAAKIDALQPSIKECFEKWAEDGLAPDIEVEGFTFRQLVEDQGKTPVAAFLALDWLLREPETAKICLSRKVR